MLNCILLVDDENISNFITEKVLKSYGEVRMVTAVTDGKQGVNYLKHQCFGQDIYACPDLILLDLNMPYYDGMELLKNYSTIGMEKTVPIVVLSNEDPNANQKKVLQDLDIPYFTKPLTADKFSAILQQISYNS
jgi:CheY-like chemotaxis protein